MPWVAKLPCTIHYNSRSSAGQALSSRIWLNDGIGSLLVAGWGTATGIEDEAVLVVLWDAEQRMERCSSGLHDTTTRF